MLTIQKMLVEEDTVYQGYFRPRRDKYQALNRPGSKERVFAQMQGRGLTEVDHADWRDPYGPEAPKATDLGQHRDPYGPATPDSTDLGGDGTSWVPSSEFIGGETSWRPASEQIGDIGGKKKEAGRTVAQIGLLTAVAVIGGVMVLDAATYFTPTRAVGRAAKKAGLAAGKKIKEKFSK